MTTLSDLASLPTPAVIEPLSFDTILSELQTEFQSRYPDYSALLASDPAVKLLEVAAYREVLLRNRINAAAKASLLAFATGSDLDHQVGVLHHPLEAVLAHHHGHAEVVHESLHSGQHLLGSTGIQRGSRLIQNEHAGVCGQHRTDGHSLPLSARQ